MLGVQGVAHARGRAGREPEDMVAEVKQAWETDLDTRPRALPHMCVCLLRGAFWEAPIFASFSRPSSHSRFDVGLVLDQFTFVSTVILYQAMELTLYCSSI